LFENERNKLVMIFSNIYESYVPAQEFPEADIKSSIYL
jgi:hypothetical protein